MDNGRAGKVRKRAIVLGQSFSTDMNANRPLSAACVLSRLADVEVVTTDFDHWTKKPKQKIQFPPIGRITYLKTLPYYDNIGPKRLLSHLLFSIRAGWYFIRHRKRFDIVYATLPFNFLAWFALRSARAHQRIIDITDIWPDVLPFSPRLVRIFRPAFALWRKMFNMAAGEADVMMAVSDSFLQETLKYVKPDCKSRRFYLSEIALRRVVPKEATLTVAYCGNLGRLYDFETLLDVISEAEHGSVQLFIVGEGDRREWLLNELKHRKLPHKYFGSIYDPTKLGGILSRAHLGFNGFKNTTAAFSTKASTYFSAGLPLLNSMEGELANLVVKHGLGFNYRSGDHSGLKQCFSQVNRDELASMSRNCIGFFESQLDRVRIREEMYEFLWQCLEN